MLPGTRFVSTKSIAALAALIPGALFVAAEVDVAKPLADQYPRVAHTGKAFSWTFSESTFNTSEASNLTYTAHGLPNWAQFDASTRTFTGTPTDDDEDTSAVTVTAADSTSSTATDDFSLVVVSDPDPLLKSSLVQQLPKASSLGRSMILPGTKLHIPYGWSFSIGWQGDTFYLPSGDSVYTYGTINGYDPLPDWLHYSNSTYALWGIAPDRPQAEGVEFTFSLNGANVEGHAGTQTNVTIVLGRGQLSLAQQGMPTVNATVGAALNYTVPASSIKIDGYALVNPAAVNITANVNNYTWLSFDNVTHTFSGTPPSDAAGGDSSSAPVNGSIPITVTDSLGKSMMYDLPLMIYQAVFSAGTLPNVYVESGKAFNVSLAQYVRNAEQANVTAAYNPANASSWITYDAATQVLSGTPPTLDASDKIQVTLQSNSAATSSSSADTAAKRSADSGPANQATFYVALNGTNPGSPSAGGSGNAGSDGSDHGSGGLSSKGRNILAAALGSAGGVILLAALILLSRRCCAAEEHDTEGNIIDDGRSPALSDDRTLYGGASPIVAAKPMKVKEGASPATIVGSPYLDPSSAKQRADDGSELRGILIGGKTYGGPSPEMREAQDSGSPERPRQHGFMSALVTGAKKKFPSSRSLVKEAATNRAAASQSVGPSESMGLGLTGLGLEGPTSDDPYTRRPAGGHSRSRASLRSSASKESWEEDLFYNSADVGPTGYQGSTLNPIIEVDEVPRRRGQNGRVSSRTGPMRHRNSHTNASPAFTTAGTFGHPTSDESSNGHLASMHGHGLPGSTDDFPTGPSENFVIETAQRVDVRGLGNGSVKTYQPHLQEPHRRSISSHANTLGETGAFEDAEDEEQPAAYMVTPSGKGRYRNSAMSAVTDDSRLQAMSPYLSYPDPAAGSDVASSSMLAPQTGAPSPRAPSFFGGASIASGTRPEDTLRAVNSGSRHNPPSPLAGQAAVPALPSNNPYAAIYSHLNTTQRAPSPTRPSRVSVETLEACVSPGERIRIKLTPPGGAAMVGGAPGSPGKRSSRIGKYVPVLDDESMQAHGTWPLWLSEWLRWDPSMFELSGEVPLDFELSEVRIALVHRKSGHTEGSGPSTPSGEAHRRQRSSDSAATAVEDQVVARLWLYVDPPARFDDGDGASSSGHGHVNLRREGAGTAF